MCLVLGMSHMNHDVNFVWLWQDRHAEVLSIIVLTTQVPVPKGNTRKGIL